MVHYCHYSTLTSIGNVFALMPYCFLCKLKVPLHVRTMSLFSYTLNFRFVNKEKEFYRYDASQ